MHFGAAPATSVSVTSPEDLVATAPTAPGGKVHITVGNQDGTSAISSADVYAFTSPPKPPPPRTAARGYWMVGASGTVYSFGALRRYGDSSTIGVTHIEPTPNRKGYWIVNAAGRVFAFGNAHRYGDAGALFAGGDRHQPVVDADRQRLLALHQPGPGAAVRRRALLRRHAQRCAQRSGRRIGGHADRARLLHGRRPTAASSPSATRTSAARWAAHPLNEPVDRPRADREQPRLLARRLRRRRLRLRRRALPRLDGRPPH